MNALDWGLVVLFFAGALIGLTRGLVRIVIGILSLLVYQNPVAEKTDPLGI